MTIQYLTFVSATSTLGWDSDTPVLVIYTNSEDEIAHLPFVEQLLHHQDADAPQITPIAQGYSKLANQRARSEPHDHRLAPVTVSNEWLRVMHEEYDQQAKIIMILQPVTSTGTAPAELPATSPAPGTDLPAWLEELFTGELHTATQDVAVVVDFLPTIAASPHVYDSVQEWAAQIR